MEFYRKLPTNELVMDFTKICRLCLVEEEPMCDIFTTYYAKMKSLYSDMIASCTKIKPAFMDQLPKQICKECVKQLKKTYLFNIKCDESNEKLLNTLKQESEENKDGLQGYALEVEYVPNTNIPSIEESKVKNDNLLKDEIKQEFNEADDGNNSSWDAEDDNVLIDVKKLPVSETIHINGDTKKKRGRKKKVYEDGEEKEVPLSKRPHQCDVCGKVLSNRGNLNAHAISHSNQRPYTCDICPSSFKSHSGLFQHKRTHTGETPYHCEFCPKKFGRRTALVNHVRLHTGEKRYRCELCSKSFTQSTQYTVHMKRHSGDKNLLCQVCGKGFLVKSDLTVHQRIHNGEKPYACKLCPKKFATSGNLSIHIRFHKKDLRYECKYCERGFVTSSAYNVHVKRHKGQKDYQCDCGKMFYTSSALKQHQVVHTGEKKYQCKICDRRFTQVSHLGRHFKRDHAKPNVPLPPSDFYKRVLPAVNSIDLRDIANNVTSKPTVSKYEVFSHKAI